MFRSMSSRFVGGVCLTLAAAAWAANMPQQNVPADISNKLRADLASVLLNAAPDEMIPITIIMKEQASREDIDALGTIADKSVRRRAVIDALKSVTKRTQGGVLDALIKGQSRGEVSGEYLHSLWIVNVVGAKMTRDMAYAIAARDDVGYLNYDRPAGAEVLPVEPPTEGEIPVMATECGVQLMGAPRVWGELGITGANIVVAMIDTGTCIDHPDLRNQIWTNPGEIAGNNIDDDGNGFVDDIHGWSFENNGSSPDINDYNGHGTHTAGTVGGDGAGGTVTGMAPNVQIMTTKFWNSFSGELSVWLCEEYAVENGAHVTSASLGWPHSTNPDRRTWREVCENTIAAGLVVVYAAGNEGCGNPPDNVRTPGDVPSVLTVGATDCGDNQASFTSCGPVTWQNVDPWRDCPHPPGCIKPSIAAPGVDTASCRNNPCNGYWNLSGTSMATPHVAGAVALMLESNPNLSHFEIVTLLEQTARDLGAPGNDNVFGYGRVDAYEAVVAAGGSNPTQGACCFEDGSCAYLFLQECSTAGGQWHYGTDCNSYSCPQPGACCLDDGSCQDLLEADCARLAGSSWSLGDCGSANCPEPGACCVTDDDCQITGPIGCEAAGGDFKGRGTGCNNACPCDKVKKLKASCNLNGTVKVVVKFVDTSYNGERIRIAIGTSEFETGVLVDKAKLVAGPFSGSQTARLVSPACNDTATATCP